MPPPRSPASPCAPKTELTSKGQAFLTVFVGNNDDATLVGEADDIEADASSGEVLAFPCRPLEGTEIAAAAHYGHDQGDKRRILRDLEPLLHHVSARGYLLRSDAERLPTDSWWLLTKRRRCLLASISDKRLAPLLRPAWMLDALSIKTRIDLSDLRRRGCFSGALIAELAGMPYDSDVAKDLAALVKAGVLRHLDRGFLADRWPSDAEVRPLDVKTVLRFAGQAEKFFSTPSKARNRALHDLKIKVPEPQTNYTQVRGLLVPTPGTGIAPHLL